MTELELDEIMTLKWRRVMRRVMAVGSEREQGFVKSIAHKGKCLSWRPSPKEAAWMQALVAEHCPFFEDDIELIER